MSELRSLNATTVDAFATHYDVKHKIGEGMFSDVWLCVQRANGQKYAAKILKQNYGSSMSADDWNTIAEVNVAKSVLGHPFLLTLEGCYHGQLEPGRVIMVSELMKRSLYDVIEADECPLPENRIKSYTYQLLQGLKYIHENGFIHRDIKPENILLKGKLLKIGDFGLACHVSEGQPYMVCVGTRWYRPPESLLTNGWYNTKFDIWSAGCVVYEMATGRPLFDGMDEYDQVNKINRVLGHPGAGLLCKFKKHSSDIFDWQYEDATTAYGLGTRGIGLHTVYKKFRPSYDVLKDMVTYDPAKRYSADRLLRKSYFLDMKNTEYEYKVKDFQQETKRNSRQSTENNSSGDRTSSPVKRMPLPTMYRTHEKGDNGQQTYRIRSTVRDVKQGQEPHNCIQIQKASGKITIASDLSQKKMPKTMTGLTANTKTNLLLKKQYTSSVLKQNRTTLIKTNVPNKKLMKRPPFK